MKTRGTALNLLISGVCISLIAIFLSGCSGSGGGGGGGSGNLYGTVINLSYSPVSNADVNVDSSSAKTLSNGTYSFINLSAGEKLIKITSTAHTSSYRRVTFSGGQSANAGVSVLANLDSKITPIPNPGGTATNTNGSIKMVFPPGAFPSITNVVLTTVPKVAAPYFSPGGDEFISYIVFSKPEETTLSQPSILSLPNLTQVPSTIEVNFYKFNTGTLVWDLLPGHGHSSPETGTIDFNTNQMGWLAAIMPIYPNPGWIEGTVSSGGTPLSGANVWTITSFDVSDQFGSYKLENVPIGTTEVYASALGYSYTPTLPWPLVSSELGTTLNIPMSVIPQGNIEGVVKELGDGILFQARVVALQGGNQKGETYTDEYGRYTLYNLPVSSTSVAAYATEHISSYEPVTVVGGSTVPNVNFWLPDVGPVASYEYTFETGAQGFTTEADLLGHNFWHRQFYDTVETSRPKNYFNESHGAVTRKVYLKDNGIISNDGRIPSPHGGSYYFWYGQTSQVGDLATSEASYIGIEASDDTVEGSGGISSDFGNWGTLESPALDLQGYTFGKLSFWTWWEVEGKNAAQGNYGHDWMLIYVSKSPYTTWDLIDYLNPYEDPAKTITVSGEAYTSGGFNQPGIWVNHNYNLTPYVGNTIKIRFVFNTGDNLYNGFRGWFIDDITVNNSQWGIFSFGENRIKNFPPATWHVPRN
jgi:hypothetical protein